MKVTPNLINELENMSALSLNDNQKKIIGCEIEEMLSFMDKIKDANPNCDSLQDYNVPLDSFARDDEVKASIDVNDALANASNTNGEYFTVPKVVD